MLLDIVSICYTLVINNQMNLFSTNILKNPSIPLNFELNHLEKNILKAMCQNVHIFIKNSYFIFTESESLKKNWRKNLQGKNSIAKSKIFLHPNNEE